MKYVYYGVNVFLVILIACAVLIKPEAKSISKSMASKILTTDSFQSIQLREDEGKEVINEEEKDEIGEAVVEDNKVINESLKSSEKEAVVVTPQQKVEEVQTVVEASSLSDVLETQVGSLAAYGPDCSGCSGHLAGGFDASSGNYIFNDASYGNVRILAGDRKYPYGSIVRVSGTRLGTFNAIILDRGGGVGFGKRFLFDLLCPSESDAANVGSFQNVVFEVLRYGY